MNDVLIVIRIALSIWDLLLIMATVFHRIIKKRFIGTLNRQKTETRNQLSIGCQKQLLQAGQSQQPLWEDNNVAQNNLGLMYENGTGVRKSNQLAAF